VDLYTLVLLRHGESTWNQQGLFTGWQDVDLSERGRAEAAEGGRLLREAGVRPDVVHTSLLRRAIHTAQLALDQLGLDWLPVRRSWRLNERHYGDLEGKDKAATLAQYGEEQFHLWRRSYDVPPPPLADDDERHPRFDARYASLPPDVLPPSECLKDVVVRALPWWHDAVVPDLRAGRVVLVAAHGNSLRALVKHLDGIGDDTIAGLNVPTGVPLVYALDPATLAPVGDRSSWAGGLRGRYLGDEAAVRSKIEAVASQGSSR
jgi:2,3-bisphosphoglycerate-dependent phosphoglycerate mutase